MIDLSDWDIKEYRGWWMARIRVSIPDGHYTIKHGEHPADRYIAVVSTLAPYEIAVDILTDFLMRLKYGPLPRGLDDPQELMEICRDAARRQR